MLLEFKLHHYRSMNGPQKFLVHFISIRLFERLEIHYVVDEEDVAMAACASECNCWLVAAS